MKLSHYQWDPEKDLIAEGGFAEVFKAKDTNTENRWVALKIYKEAVSRGTTGSTGQKKYSLEQEFAKIDGLSHTNIITFYGLEYIEHKDAMGRTVSYPVLIMEYAGEGTLKELSVKQLSHDDLEEIVVSIIKATGYLHSQGVIHRDLKPGNVLFSKDRNGKYVAKITDFGISKDVLGDKTIEQSFTEGVGTPHYMAPEQFFKKKFGLKGEVSERTDIWAIGVILYQLLTGRRPFGHGMKDYELIRDEITQKEVNLTTIPGKYQAIINKCLEKEASRRGASANELLKLIEPQSYDEDLTIIPGQNVRITNPSISEVKPKRNIITYAIIGLLIVAAGFGGFKWYQHSKTKELLATGWDYYKDGKFKEAYNSYNDASDYNSGKAYYYLALMNEQGRGVDRNYQKVVEYANKAIDKGYDMAAYYLGDLYENGWGVPIDSLKATEYYEQSLSHVKKLAKDDNVEAMHLFGLLYSDKSLKIFDSIKSFQYVKKATDKGHPIAKSNLANWYRRGIGVEKNCEEALKLLKEGLTINFDRSINDLGNLYYYGCGNIEFDFKEALKYYRKAANLGNINSQFSIGYMYHLGKGVPIDLDEALIWYSKAAEGDHVTSITNLGYIYRQKKNYEKAKKYFEKAANKNHIEGIRNLGLLYFNGQGVSKNLDSANYYFQKAALKNSVKAQIQYGYNFDKGNGLVQNNDSAFYWYEKAASQNYSIGQYNLGYMYENGYGCKQDYAMAKDLYEKAARQGYQSAYHAIGSLYYDGNGVKKNYFTARKWYKKAADKDYITSQYMLGHMNETEKGGAKNYKKAREWYNKAAKEGHANSQQALGGLYIDGKGGSRNYNLGFKWIEKGAKNGSNEGARKLGLCYFYGYGVEKSKSQARLWLNKSCENKNRTACNQINELL